MVKAKIPDDVVREIFPRKLKKNLLSTQVYNCLKEMILKGKLKRGERLIQESLALRLDISRTALKAVLLKLKKEGLIIGRKDGGLIVK